ncbi:MAG: polyprenyl synthetase family protein [Anaerolineales bacterium]|nr:polyprenyl synthetase family protein [Anaerolineales bacterium]
MERTEAYYTELVRNDLVKVETLMREVLHGINPNIKNAVDHLLSAGGKRVRPTLTLLVGGMLDSDHEKIVTLAAAIEMLHTATLIHDDLIDGALLRRGNPTLNAQWSAGATVLTGDYIFARAAQLAADTGSIVLMKIFSEKLMIIVNGEITQLFREFSSNIRKDYFDRIYAKTASLFEVAAHGPAILSGEDQKSELELKSFGYELGIAFQIVDDILDFVGDPNKIGKPAGNDLRQGLITLPAVVYFESHPEDPAFDAIMNDPEPNVDLIDPLIARIRVSGAIDQSLQEAREYVASAQSRIENMPESQERDALFELADFVVKRPF